MVTVQLLVRFATGDGDFGGVGDDDVVSTVVCGKRREGGKGQKTLISGVVTERLAPGGSRTLLL